MADWIACDLETTGLDFINDTILSFAHYTPREHGVLTDLGAIKTWFVDHAQDNLVWHSGKFDIKFLKQIGIEAPLSWDTLLAESLLSDRPARLSLEEVAGKELGVPKWKDAAMYADMGRADPVAVATLNLQDVRYTYEVFKAQCIKLREQGLLKFFLENALGMASVQFLAGMEYRGIGLDYEKMQTAWKTNLAEHERMCTELYGKFGPLVAEYEEAQFAKCTSDPARSTKDPALLEKRRQAQKLKCRFNFNSPKQVLWLLQTKLGFPCKNLEGKDSTGKDVLEFYRGQHEVIDGLLALRSNEHDSGSFFKNWDKFYRQGRLHPSYHQDTAKTYRLSCTEPALQQVPRGSTFRELFIPGPGYDMMVVDYSQIEPRMIAHYSADPVLTQIFRESYDLYEYVAREILHYTGTSADLKLKHASTRAIAKEIALSSFYGIGPDKFAFRLRLKTGHTTTAAEARRYLNSYFDMLAGVKEYRRWLADRLTDDYVFTTVFGRKLFFKRGVSVHLPFNMIMQCSGSDINLYSQITLDKYFKYAKLDAHCVHLVHDEAVFEYRAAEEEQVVQAVEYIMAERYKSLISVPIKLDIKVGANWGCKG